jgi:hypothetical protein
MGGAADAGVEQRRHSGTTPTAATIGKAIILMAIAAAQISASLASVARRSPLTLAASKETEAWIRRAVSARDEAFAAFTQAVMEAQNLSLICREGGRGAGLRTGVMLTARRP